MFLKGSGQLLLLVGLLRGYRLGTDFVEIRDARNLQGVAGPMHNFFTGELPYPFTKHHHQSRIYATEICEKRMHEA